MVMAGHVGYGGRVVVVGVVKLRRKGCGDEVKLW